MKDRGVRNLARLEQSGSTARVLNLHLAHRKFQHLEDYNKSPLFRHPRLNRAIYIKHRLRPHEVDLFADGRQSATKIVLPIDSVDLSLGGRYVFIGERSYRSMTAGTLGENFSEGEDLRTLDLLDEIPSLDPFLLKDHLIRNGVEPSGVYFDVSQGDLQKMFSFVEGEISHLVNLSFDGADFQAGLTRLVRKMLSNTIDADLDPLRRTLRMAPDQFSAGVFSWRGFLYYKWKLRDLLDQAAQTLEGISSIWPRGHPTAEQRHYIEATRKTLRRDVHAACKLVAQILQVYDDAYAELTQRGNPQGFRAFLLDAPARFAQLGERLGVLDHIVSFWRFRFPAGRFNDVSTEALIDVFSEFEEALKFVYASVQPVSLPLLPDYSRDREVVQL